MLTVAHCGGHDRVGPRFPSPIDIMTPIGYSVIRTCHRRHPGTRVPQTAVNKQTTREWGEFGQ